MIKIITIELNSIFKGDRVEAIVKVIISKN